MKVSFWLKMKPIVVCRGILYDVVNDVESRRRPAGRELAEFRDDTARALGPEPPILSVQPAEPARRSLRPPTATRCLENDGRERAADAVLTSPRRKEVGEVGDGEIVEPLNECRFAGAAHDSERTVRRAFTVGQPRNPGEPLVITVPECFDQSRERVVSVTAAQEIDKGEHAV